MKWLRCRISRCCSLQQARMPRFPQLVFTRAPKLMVVKDNDLSCWFPHSRRQKFVRATTTWRKPRQHRLRALPSVLTLCKMKRNKIFSHFNLPGMYCLRNTKGFNSTCFFRPVLIYKVCGCMWVNIKRLLNSNYQAPVVEDVVLKFSCKDTRKTVTGIVEKLCLLPA